MKNWIIKKLIEWETRLNVLTLKGRKVGFKYHYADTIMNYYDKNVLEWVDWGKSVKSKSLDPLLQSKIDDGWYLIKIWHSTKRKGIWDTHWIFERKLNA